MAQLTTILNTELLKEDNKFHDIYMRYDELTMFKESVTECGAEEAIRTWYFFGSGDDSFD